MTTIQQPARALPVIGHYDTIVCGGGPAGFAAAIAASRNGASTLLIERYGFLGGTGTAGLMVDFGTFHDGTRPLVGGVLLELLTRMEDRLGAHRRNNEITQGVTYDVEAMIAVCQAMALEAGVTLRLHTMVTDVIMEGDRVTGVALESKSGREAVTGRVFIDATGDGDLAAFAGADYVKGREGDGKMQPVSHELIVGGVDMGRVPKNHRELVPAIEEARAAGAWPIPTERFFSWGPVPKCDRHGDPSRGYYFLNVTNALDVDGTRADDLTRAEIECRNQVDPLVDFLRKNAPGFENCWLDRTATQIGVRETRRIVGEHVLMRDDVLAARHFADGVVPAMNSIDVHDLEGKHFDHEFLKEGTHYQVPWRCLIPKRLEGLIVAGRCLSADHKALGSARVMVICTPMGEAAGRGAALAVREKCGVREGAGDEVREGMRAAGTVIE